VISVSALGSDAEGADLPRPPAVRVDPAARVSVSTSGIDAEGGAGVDHRGLEGPHERPQEQAATRQRESRVGDELTRTVVRDLAAALDPDDLDPAPVEVRGRRPD